MQNLIKDTNAYKLLQKERRENTLSHAYLLAFDDEKNLPVALKTFAKLLFGAEETEWGFPSDREKRIASLIDENTFSDCQFFPVGHTKLNAEDAEKIVEESLIRPLEGDLKVFLIDRFDEALAPAQNKLLKVLEEPPKGVVFILGAKVTYSVLPTVLSRTEKLEILPFTTEEVYTCLQRNHENEGDISLCAAVSGGIVGRAENFLEGGFYKTLSSSAFELCLSTPNTLPINVKKIAETKYKTELITLLRTIFRDALCVKIGNPQRIFLKPERERIEKIAETYTLAALIKAEDEFSTAEKNIKFNANFSQLIEICFALIFKRNEN